MPGAEKSKSHSVRLWRALLAERTAELAYRREARAMLVSLLDKEIDALVDAPEFKPTPLRSRRLRFLV